MLPICDMIRCSSASVATGMMFQVAEIACLTRKLGGMLVLGDRSLDSPVRYYWLLQLEYVSKSVGTKRV